MKNERRHKLSQNSLANFLEKSVNTAKENSATITRLVPVLLVSVLLLLLWRTFATTNKHGFSNDMKQLIAFNMSKLDEEQFENTIKTYVTKYPSGVNNATVSLLIGDIYLNRATIFRDAGKRDQAIACYEMALDYYSTADKFQFKQQDAAESAVWGLAQTNAALAALKESDDYLNAAKSSFERLCINWPDGKHYELATEQLNYLTRPSTVTFLSKYRQADPALFAPDLKIPDLTAPTGDLDTTITPGDFQVPPSFLSPESDIQEFDPGLPITEAIGSETQETPQHSDEPQNTVSEPATEADAAP